MTQEALKLALEELAVRFSEGWHEGIKIDASDIMLLNEAAQALAQPEQEPDKYLMEVECTKCGAKESGVLTFKATPPQRTWVGLTDEEYFALQMKIKKPMTTVQDYIDAMRIIEQALKEKNT